MTNGLPHNPHIYNGPSFVNFVWPLTGTQNHLWHLLMIQTQYADVDYTASIVGSFGSATQEWVPDKGTQTVTGQIIGYPNDSTSFRISFRWSPDNYATQTNTLTGTLTYVPPTRIGGPSGWALKGSVIVTDGNGNVTGEPGYGAGPGDVSGTAFVGLTKVVEHI